MFSIRRLKKEAKVWWCFTDEKLINKTWFQDHFMHARLNEKVNWTVHFCTPAIMTYRGTTQAWPTCDPFKGKCDGGRSLKLNLAKRNEWACFNANKRDQVGYLGISFANWIKIKFGERQLNKQVDIQYRDEWVKANFLVEDLYSMTPRIAPNVWDHSPTPWNKNKGKYALEPT